MARQTTAQIFRDTATEEQWKQLVADANATTPIGKDIQDKYGFSWAAISDDAAEKGYYEKKRRASSSAVGTSEPRIFIVDDIGPNKGKPKTRSVQLDPDVLERLKKLEDSKMQYTHAAILNQLLKDALALYGY